jgi:50S ribosomal protein L16 3-hydroxylase
VTNADDYEASSYDPRIFFANYWRKKPMLLRGGARVFMDRVWTASDFELACAKAYASDGAVKERQGEVTFVERISLFAPDLREIATRVSKKFGSDSVWFDGVRTYRRQAGLGRHFDHSDNFVLQQAGVKNWKLESPRRIDDDTIKRRMLNLGSVDCPDFSENSINFVLESGDLLYIPLFWIHDGTSEAESLSLSLVLPALSVFAAAVPLMNIAIRKVGLGYKPLTMLHAYLSDAERSAALAEIRRETQALLDHVSDIKVKRLVQVLQAEYLRTRTGSTEQSSAISNSSQERRPNDAR